MEDVRLANMFYEQRGPLVFSASVHLALLVVGSVWLLLMPDKEKEPFQFELVPPPSGGAVQSESMPTLDSIEYEPVEANMPTLADMEVPERVYEIERPEPVVEKPEPVVDTAPPKEQSISLDDFFKDDPDRDKVKNVRTTPAKTQKRPLLEVPQFKGIEIANLPPAEIASYSQADQDALGSYIAGFKISLKNAVASHPLRGTKLSALVICDILANGSVRNVRILRPSGDAEFDRKVLAGYKRLANYARPPKGKALLGLEIEFIQ